jgi:N-acetylmuramoyl-L-alanine amidase
MKPSALVIHHTAGSQYQSIDSVRADQVRRGYADYAYHFGIVVDKTTGRGHLQRGRPDTMNGCHGNNHYNKNALGFCVHGNYDKYPPSEELYQDILAGVKHVIKLYKISPAKVIGHKEIKALRPGEKCTATACPGRYFPLERLKRDLLAGK